MVRKIKDRTRARFHLGLCEVGGQDTWQRIGLGFALVSTERHQAEAMVGEVVRFIESLALAEVAGDEREVLGYGDDPLAMPGKPLPPMEGMAEHMRETMDEAGVADESIDDDWIPDEWKSGDAEPERS